MMVYFGMLRQMDRAARLQQVPLTMRKSYVPGLTATVVAYDVLGPSFQGVLIRDTPYQGCTRMLGSVSVALSPLPTELVKLISPPYK